MVLKTDKMTTRSSVVYGQGFEGVPNLPIKKFSKKSSCLKCHAGGDVLVCSNGDCPIVVHRSCMSCIAWLNDSGSFWCPYCLYRRSIIECHQAKEKVLMARNALSCFLDLQLGNTGNPENSKSKRKRPDGSMQNITNATCIRVETTKTACQNRLVEGDHHNGNFKYCTLASEPLAAGPPRTHSSSWGQWAAAKESESLTKKAQENLHTVEADQCRSDGSNEQMEEERQETFGRLNKMDTTIDVNGESKEGNFSPIQNDSFASHEEVISDNAEEFAEIRNHYSRADERQKIASHLMGDESVLVTHEESGKLTEKHQENLKIVEGLHEGAETTQKQSNPQETCKCFTRKDNMMERHEQYDMGNGDVVQDNVVRSQMEAHLKDTVQPTGAIGKTLEELHNAGRLKKQILAEAQESSVYLNRKESTTELYNECNGNDGTCGGKCYATSQMEVNSENADHLAQAIEDHTRKDNRQTLMESPKDVLHVMRKNCLSVADEESEILMKTNQIGEKADRYHDGEVEKEHSLPETPQKTLNLKTSDDAVRMHETSAKENGGVFEDGYFIRKDVAINSWNADQPAETGDCQRLDDRQKAKLPTNDVQCMQYRVIHEESDSGNNSASTENSCCVGHGVSSKRKSQIPKSFKNDNQPGNISESSENELSEVEEYKEVALSKSGKKVAPVKRMKRSVLYSVRRRKLPWTVEEAEMLKEGVQKFSLAAKKNLPWMKILEFGCHIFDGTRTPVDLKDKWRNIMGKINYSTIC
ncbi:hypothetical protein Cgig2_029971 [Carnegiea gigantea]|uniref:Myb-like domain-containing protein n=1 Tax=Carnegiea gigantea TaxID=171969 RepID=A0A9Q1GRE6_9CARY|nr:hypothetical protein Cgig2_029971 [Carnegiea gigantea]